MKINEDVRLALRRVVPDFSGLLPAKLPQEELLPRVKSSFPGSNAVSRASPANLTVAAV